MRPEGSNLVGELASTAVMQRQETPITSNPKDEAMVDTKLPSGPSPGALEASRLDSISSSLMSAMAPNPVEEEKSKQVEMKESSNLTTAEAAASSSEEGGVDSSSGSSGKTSDPAVVTANNTTSSSEDRGSSCRNRGGGSNANNNSSSSDDRFMPSNQVRESKIEHSPVSHHYHHHHSRQKKHDGTNVTSSDGFGLPVPRDDRLRSEISTEHATVVARLPPPNTDTTSSGSGGEFEERGGSLLQPYREPGFHTIRRTFNRFLHRDSSKQQQNSETDSSGEHLAHRKMKHSSKRQKTEATEGKTVSTRKRAFRDIQKNIEEDVDKDGGGSNDENGGSSGSGTEGGYAGSASSNEPAQVGSCSSPSVSSSESGHSQRKHIKGLTTLSGDPNRQMLSKKQESSLSVSSEIADFSSGISESAAESYSLHAFRESSPSPSDSPSITSYSNGDGSSDDQDDKTGKQLKTKPRKRANWPPLPLQVPTQGNVRRKRVHIKESSKTSNATPGFSAHEEKPPILVIGCDVMAHILTFLEPPEILNVLTAPLSKDWLWAFTRQPELWRVLCLLEPFKAQVDDDVDESSEDSLRSYPFDVESELRRTFGKFRLLYTAFVRCMDYLARIKDDAANGRSPSIMESTNASTDRKMSSGRHLRNFLSRARGIVQVDPKSVFHDNIGRVADEKQTAHLVLTRCSRKRKKRETEPEKKERRLTFGHSVLTQRLLGPSMSGEAGDGNLPWSCAIYAIVNWMTAFSHVEGIQIMCLKVLPPILENEQQRMIAQRAGLTDTVLRSMVLFPDSAQLHTAAFHAVVLLARPLGGQEGMLFHTSMISASGIFNNSGGHDGRNGIAVMLDSMKRFSHDEVLQAMSCWSLVNVALSSDQKRMLVKLGGIQATTNAMMLHPYNPEVQVSQLLLVCHNGRTF